MNSGTANALSHLDEQLFGDSLPEPARRCLSQAGLLRSVEPERALRYLEQARSLAPEHPATLIALYRFHFYGHGLREARGVAEAALALGARLLGLSERDPVQALPGARYEAGPRFYLFALKGYAYLSLRLGELEDAARALKRLQALDPDDRVGGALLGEVMNRAGRDDDDDDTADGN